MSDNLPRPAAVIVWADGSSIAVHADEGWDSTKNKYTWLELAAIASAIQNEKPIIKQLIKEYKESAVKVDGEKENGI